MHLPTPRCRTSLAALGKPPPGAVFAQFFNFADAAAARVSPDGALQSLPVDAHKNIKKIYAANATHGVTTLHPSMLALWRRHPRAPAPAAPAKAEDWRSMIAYAL